jgi:Co/Zn/Cd efflux system component
LSQFPGACVIVSWSYGLIRDTGAILLDMNPDRTMASKLRHAVEGDQLADLHLWRLGPGHLGVKHPETRFQLPHRMAERRGRDVKSRCGSSKAPLIGNSDECGQIGQVATIHC